jgi:hypothetical protein
MGWAASSAFGCGSSNDEGNGPGGGPGLDGGDDSTTSILGGGGDGAIAQTLVVTPANPVMTVTQGTPATQQFQALVNGNPVKASWTLDVADVGTIDANGLFTASGNLGGPVTVTAIAGQAQGSTTLTIHLSVVENPGNVDPGTQGALQGGGTADTAFKWLYPYDATVLPRDVPSPSMQFAATIPASTIAYDAAYVHVTAANLDYKGFFGPTPAGQPARVQLSAAAWKTITGSAGGGKVKVDVTKIAGGAVTGPTTETWTIAAGNLRGSIYYNSYSSALANGTGAILRLRPGSQAELTIPTNANGECHVCHAVSANGTTLVAADERLNGNLPQSDTVYDLTNDAGILHTTNVSGTSTSNSYYRVWDFGALTPDGTRFLRYGSVPDQGAAGEPWAPNVRGLGESKTDPTTGQADNGERPSALFDSHDGSAIPAPGLDGQKLHMMMPAFSPDGKHVAFNHYDTGAGKTIATMDFDPSTNTFSNLKDVVTLPTGYAGWPAFTPDSEYLFFAAGTDAEYDTVSDDTSHVPQPTSDLSIAHVPSKTMASADALNGVANGASYLPFPDDPHLNFEPTILPVAAGGYYWVVFTSRRNYGNTVNGDPYVGSGGAPSPRKKLWVAAIDIDSAEHPATAARDITHPAFYLDGQELSAGNMRAFWALDPCHPQGDPCNTGDECCSGFCRQTNEPDGAVVFACVPPSGCSHESEKCTTAADCCDVNQGAECINGFCAKLGPR